MICLLSDVHCRYGVITAQLLDAETRFGIPPDAVVVLGDLGLFEPFLTRFFRRSGERFPVPVHFIEGNHEDFNRFDRLVRRYEDVLHYLPRGSVHALAGVRVLALGGVTYMDAHTTPAAAEVRPRDIARCLRHPRDGVEIVLSHDCPAGIGVTNRPGFEHYGPPGLIGSSQLLQHFEPRLWIFGHHHRWFDRTIGATRFFGLPQSWVGYAVLGNDGQLVAVDHAVADVRQPGWTPWLPFLRAVRNRRREESQ